MFSACSLDRPRRRSRSSLDSIDHSMPLGILGSSGRRSVYGFCEGKLIVPSELRRGRLMYSERFSSRYWRFSSCENSRNSPSRRLLSRRSSRRKSRRSSRRSSLRKLRRSPSRRSSSRRKLRRSPSRRKSRRSLSLRSSRRKSRRSLSRRKSRRSPSRRSSLRKSRRSSLRRKLRRSPSRRKSRRSLSRCW